MTAEAARRSTGAGRIGFTCAYTPLPLIRAAGFLPHRLLPLSDAPDRAGELLHDNMCPHVKRVLDRAMSGDLPELGGVVVMNSCDAMRRLADAWASVRPAERVVVVDLPTTETELSVKYFASELGRLRDLLGEWAGRAVGDDDIVEAIEQQNELARGLRRLYEHARNGGAGLPGGRRALQELLNLSVTESVETCLARVGELEAEAERSAPPAADYSVPLFLFGNVMADPAAFELFESRGGRVVGDDLCTGARQIVEIECDRFAEPIAQLASATLRRPPCARTLPVGTKGGRDRLAEQVLAGVGASGARGVIAHVMKFCDPYLARMPELGRRLDREGVPLLVLEGDCTTRSLGQQATRIEAFIEMLGEV
ncbi:MAG: 2-hydroxyacyl-CoA dehydratase [Deltaproteobacteria bacterium]|nr:2-hydroxyacyl-CoA dehydratase [Deltaproteobacteria bacterium]